MLPLNLIAELETRKIVTRTFRRLDFDKQDALYHAALEAFAFEGYEDANMDKIGRKLNTGGGALYRYVENKEKLFHFVAEVLLHSIAEKLEKLLESGSNSNDGETAIKKIFEAIHRLAAENRTEFRVLLKAIYELEEGEAKTDFFNKYTAQLAKSIGQLLRAGIQKGEVRKNLDIDAASILILELAIKIIGAGYAAYLSNIPCYSGETGKKENPIVKLLEDAIGQV